MTPYDRVKLSRERTAATFPLPSVLDCIRYAITELAEYDDALLRQERTGDKRNNDKAHDPRTELGQALYMLLSAAVQLKSVPSRTDRLYHSPFFYYAQSIEYLGIIITRYDQVIGCDWDSSGIREQVKSEIGQPMNSAYQCLCHLCEVNRWHVQELIDDACAAFEAKHAAHYTGEAR